MKIAPYIFSVAAALLLSTAPALAQELNEQVSVEGVFKAQEVQRDRINVFPERGTFAVERFDLPFDTQGVVADFPPTANPIAVTGWRASRPDAPKGYVDLSLGSWLNSSLSAGYSVLSSPLTHLDISLQHNSTSLWRPKMSSISSDVKRFRYDESIAARFYHRFPDLGLLEASLAYRLGYFNYYSYVPYAYLSMDSRASDSQNSVSAPTQTLNDFAFRTGWHANPSRGNEWSVVADLRYFGYRSLYLPHIDLNRCSGERETTLNLSAAWSHTWTSGSVVGVDITGTGVFYSGKNHFSTPNVSLPKIESYGNILLNPYYTFSNRNLMVRVGADMNFTINADGNVANSHFSLFHISPDIRFDWRAKAVGLYLDISGGTQLQTLATASAFDYYRMPALPSTQPVYVPVDARIGADFGPFKGFDFGASVGYRVSKHLPLEGWYMTLLDYNHLPVPGIAPTQMQYAYGTSRQGLDIQGFSFDLHASYAFAGIGKVSAEATYQPQNGETGWFNGFDRPRWTLKADAEVTIIKKLHLGVGYEYRGVRSIYTPCMPTEYFDTRSTIINGGGNGSIINPSTPSQEGEEVKLASLRLPDITNLNAKISYDLTPRLKIGVSAYNLLNLRVESLPSLPTEGIDIQGTLSFTF